MRGYNSPHEAVQAIEAGIDTGRFRPCANLSYNLSGGAFRAVEHYYPVCRQDSFLMPGHFDQFSEEDVSCPADCRMFVDLRAQIAINEASKALAQKAAERFRFWQRAESVFTAPFRYFSGLSGIAQGMIILLIIVYFSPRLAEAITTVIKALK